MAVGASAVARMGSDVLRPEERQPAARSRAARGAAGRRRRARRRGTAGVRVSANGRPGSSAGATAACGRRPGRGWSGAAFRHRTSRAADPQLHTHVLLANLVATRDGGWRAVWSRGFYRHARAAGALYRAALRDSLTRELGVTGGPVSTACTRSPASRTGCCGRSAGAAPRSNRPSTSRGDTSAKAAGVATLTTRRSKQAGVDGARLQAEWRQRADDLGFTADRVRDVLGHHGRELLDSALEALTKPLTGVLTRPLTRAASPRRRRRARPPGSRSAAASRDRPRSMTSPAAG